MVNLCHRAKFRGDRSVNEGPGCPVSTPTDTRAKGN